MSSKNKERVFVIMKRNNCLLVAAILGTLYVLYLIVYFAGAMSDAPDTETTIGAGIATALVMPHMICVAIAVIFNWVGWSCRVRWGALVAGILYAVSMLLMFLYALFVLPQMILCFIAFAKMKVNNTVNTVNTVNTANTQIQNNNDTSFCTQCGSKLMAGNGFCPNCGSKIE